ncbi:MAG: segregation/condensation protein A, partial [Methylophilaceae bacterium]
QSVIARASNFQHHKIGRAELSVREHMSQILRRLKQDKMVEFTDLFDIVNEGIPKLVVCFLAILELAREGLVKITQQAAFTTIYLQISHAD